VVATFMCATLALAASEESVDQRTRQALALDVHRAQGRAEFREHCARCHGGGATGDAMRAVPALAGQRFAYLVRQLIDFAGEQRESATMHAVLRSPGLRSPQTWVDIAGYLNRAPVSFAVERGGGRQVSLGGAIFREQCASCHQSEAQGDREGFVPSLRHQHHGYLVTQLHRIGHGDRHTVDENLARFLRSFDEAEIDAVADYLSRLEGRGTRVESMRADGTVVD